MRLLSFFEVAYVCHFSDFQTRDDYAKPPRQVSGMNFILYEDSLS